jgi:hypothetical protein
MDEQMKRLVVFVIWFLLMSIITLPIGWYLFAYYGVSIDTSEFIMIALPVVIFLLFIISETFRDAIIYVLKFPFHTLDELSEARKKNKIKRYSKRGYIKMKLRL